MIISFSVYLLFHSTLQILKTGWSDDYLFKNSGVRTMLPRENYFKVAMVFGQKAFDAILGSNVRDDIKNELISTKVYAEGRGIRIEITDSSQIDDIKTLIDIKLAH